MRPRENTRTIFLVVIIIIGLVVLAAIALPSFLNQGIASG